MRNPWTVNLIEQRPVELSRKIKTQIWCKISNPDGFVHLEHFIADQGEVIFVVTIKVHF